jgi:hypothetical protein
VVDLWRGSPRQSIIFPELRQAFMSTVTVVDGGAVALVPSGGVFGPRFFAAAHLRYVATWEVLTPHRYLLESRYIKLIITNEKFAVMLKILDRP